MKVKNSFLTLLFSFWLMSFCAQNTQLKNYTIADGLPENAIVDISQDQIGYLWFATKNSGILRFDGKDFEIFNTNSGLISNKINDLFFQKDSLFIGTDLGLSIKVNNQIKNIKSQEILNIFYFKNTIYLTSKKGLSILKSDEILPVKLHTEIDKAQINDVIFDGKNYWIASKKALFKINDLQKPTSILKIDAGHFTSLLFYENQLLTSKENEGLFLIENEKLTKKINTSKNIFNTKKINNQLWIFSKNDGIDLLNSPDFSFIKKVNKYNSLKTNYTQTVFKDQQNTIWIATLDAGFYRFQKSNSEENLIKKPTIYFENIEVIYKPIDSININNYGKVLSLKPNQNHISFSFKSVDISNPKSIKYRYKLNGQFSPWTSKTNVNFANLDAGNYSFIAEARRGDEKSELKKFQFFIDKEFYQKTWFLASIFGSLLLMIFLIIYLNIRKTKRKNKERITKLELENHLISLEQKALQLQMNPHFIFNVLNGIKALGSAGNTIELNKTVNQFATLLRSILQNSRKEEISLKEEIETLQNYIALEQKMASIPFEYSFNLSLNNTDSEEILIPPMLLQPFIENAIKHAFNLKTTNNKIDISFSIKNKFLHCSVEDNGIGFHQKSSEKETKNHQSIAIKVTKERIETITKYNVFSMEETKERDLVKGTKVSFKIPLKTDY